ncbi:MAG: hypothetical protein M3Q81_01730 [bacterium]|nr:hypothetical protein [bacterium]
MTVLLVNSLSQPGQMHPTSVALTQMFASYDTKVVSEDLLLADAGNGPEAQKKRLAHYKKIVSQLKKTDALLLEGSVAGIEIGYLLAIAMEVGKPVAIFAQGTISPIFELLEKTTEKALVIPYEAIASIEDQIGDIVDFLMHAQDTRFNFFVSADVSNFLDWISKDQRIPRSVYLRNLIEEDMAAQPDFSAE